MSPDPPASWPVPELGPDGTVRRRRMAAPTRARRGWKRVARLGSLPTAIAATAVALLVWTAQSPVNAPVSLLPASATVSVAVSPPPTPYIQHIVFILLENQPEYDVVQNGPYQSYLAATYGNVTNMYAACHPSAPNYLALLAGETNQCGTDNWYNYTNTTVGNLLTHEGLTWASFAQDLPSNACSSPGTATSGLFATRHVPFLYFADDLRFPAYCHQHLHTGLAFQSDVANGTLANYSFFTPNLCNDGHNPCGGNTTLAEMERQTDAWLKGFLPPILNHTGMYNTSPERKLIAHTLFIILYDEGEGINTNGGFAVPGITSGDTYAWCQANGAKGDAVCGGHIYAVFVSPYSVGTQFTQNTSDYGIVHTVEWLFHLPHLKNPGRFDASSAFPAMRSLFSFKENGK